MLARNLELTTAHKLSRNPADRDADVARLRELRADVDRAILACYGWQDLEPGHGFHQNERGQTRYTVSPDARRALLRRLLELNLRLAGEEEGRVVAASSRARADRVRTVCSRGGCTAS